MNRARHTTPVSDQTLLLSREKRPAPPPRRVEGERRPGHRLVVVYDTVSFVMKWKKPRQPEPAA